VQPIFYVKLHLISEAFLYTQYSQFYHLLAFICFLQQNGSLHAADDQTSLYKPTVQINLLEIHILYNFKTLTSNQGSGSRGNYYDLGTLMLFKNSQRAKKYK
jgi:hypothetical protein